MSAGTLKCEWPGCVRCDPAPDASVFLCGEHVRQLGGIKRVRKLERPTDARTRAMIHNAVQELFGWTWGKIEVAAA